MNYKLIAFIIELWPGLLGITRVSLVLELMELVMNCLILGLLLP